MDAKLKNNESTLDINFNQLTSIDVSNDTALEVLNLSFNQLTEINASNIYSTVERPIACATIS